MDPLTEIAEDVTPYHYCLNNPISNVDPTGMWTETANGYTTNDPQEISDFFQCFSGQQNPNNQDPAKKDKTKEESQESEHKADKEKPLSWVQKQLIKSIWLFDMTLNYWSDYFGGPGGSTIEKVQYWTNVYASGKILVIVGQGSKAFLREVKIPEGFKKVKGKSHGAPVYKKGNLYISPDIDGHNPNGVWKAANSIENLGKKETRLGTYDANLKRIGD